MNTTTIENDRATTSREGEPWFEGKDVAAFIVAAVMMLGPLAAATLFA